MVALSTTISATQTPTGYTFGVSPVSSSGKQPATTTDASPRASAPSYYEQLQALFSGGRTAQPTVTAPRIFAPTPTQLQPVRAPVGTPAPPPPPTLTPPPPRPPRVLSRPGPTPPAVAVNQANQLRMQLQSLTAGVRQLIGLTRSPENAQRLSQLAIQMAQVTLIAQGILSQGFGGGEMQALEDTVRTAGGMLQQGRQKLELWQTQAQVEALQQQLALQTPTGVVPGPADPSLIAQIHTQLAQGMSMLQQAPTEEIRMVVGDLVVAGQDIISRGRPATIAEEVWDEFVRTVNNAGAAASQAIAVAAPSLWQTVKPYAPWAVAGAAGLGILYLVLR